MSNYREAINELKKELDEMSNAAISYKSLAESRAMEIGILKIRIEQAEAVIEKIRQLALSWVNKRTGATEYETTKSKCAEDY